ncbi:hypothetical protein CGRA01v4_05921 [Colletotrichum graminicola]|uniref:Uncharacterized protein n=1 Tax=Colletotrichum graminicola (strain M1.001 / M2 / FGSC 10212) TaxID=645133 RepID=E3QNJ9_COLGM|nr:uncharacterized protein GLRG_07756 [Colletotrichum graminicola M1.001]EFQ32486.1 hypothetical protein GLRG_07756 [Colletotrichum graminicola M1.001]WDK14640.1 hypothetical protein CGRA01v4_05921 [Colletotrichum graminicola]
MSALNPFIANGTCFHGPDEAVEEWLPCGNVVFGDKSCCQAGDMCLSSRACYNGRFGITYLAGCSDPEYRHPSCPDKGAFSDQPWAGLVYCNGTSEEWVACEQSARPTTLTSADACWCPQTSRTVAFADAATLRNVVQLPTALGGSVIWQPGFVPMPTQPSGAAPPAATPTSDPMTTFAKITTTRAAGSSSLPQATDTGTSPDGADAGLSTGATVGAAVGGTGGGVLLLAVIVYLCRKWRESRTRTPAEREHAEMDGTGPGLLEWKPGSRKSSARTGQTAELESPAAARPMSELDNTQIVRYGFRHDNFQATGTRPMGPIAELPG